MPKVSVILPSYNHARFVEQAVRSALDQDFPDMEVIVCDDASTDNSQEILGRIDDPRLTVLALEQNLGASTAANLALSHATGEYIAKLGSDDLCLPGRLSRQADYLDAHAEVDAVTAAPEFIDEAGRPISPPPEMNVFAVENRSRQEWLRRLFEQGNCLSIVSMMCRRRTLLELSGSRELFRHLPDFDFWVRFLLRHELHILPDKCTGFRVHGDGSNLSAPKPEKNAEAEAELLCIWKWFLTPEGLEALELPTGIMGRLALAEKSLQLGGSNRKLFAIQTLLETDLRAAGIEEKSAFLLRANPLLRDADALGVLGRSRMREARDKWKDRCEEAEARLHAITKSRLGRILAKFLPGAGRDRPSGGSQP